MDDVKSSWPLQVGLHTCYNGNYSGLIPKSCLSSDWGLQLDPMKSESLVIVDQHATVNTFPGLEAADHGRLSDWGEVVTR